MFSRITPRLAVASVYDDAPAEYRKLDVRGMIDGAGNAQALIDKYVGDGLKVLGEPNTKLLVVCDYGRSRSNFIAAHILSKFEKISFEVAVKKILSLHADSQIKRSLLGASQQPRLIKQIGRVAISGGYGFIGKALTQQLRNDGLTVCALSRDLSGEYLSSSAALSAAIAEFEPDVFVHLAHPKPFNDEATLQAAFAQLVAVTDYCEDQCVPMLFPSSWVVFEQSLDSQVTGSSRTCPYSRYARLKAAIECYIHHSVEAALIAKIVRLPGVFGTESLDPRFFRYFAGCGSVEADIVVHEFQNGFARVPLAHIDDVVSAIALAIKEYYSLKPVSHIATSIPSPSVFEIAQEFAKFANVNVRTSPVCRTAFNGYFVPDILVHGTKSSGSGIGTFIRGITGKAAW